MAKEKFLFLFIDVETTGHDCQKRVGNALIPWHEIIDIGAVAADPATREIAGSLFEMKVKPEHPERCLPDLINHYPRRAAEGEWDSAISLSEAISSFFAWIENIPGIPVPGGQNFFFDWNFLTTAFFWCGIAEEEWGKRLHYTRFDTRSMAIQELALPRSEYDPSAYSLRNDRLAKRLGISAEPIPHKAVNGAMQSYAVWRALQELKEARWQ